MSLGNQGDDSDFRQYSVLKEAASRMIFFELDESSAIQAAESIIHRREEADASDEVVRDGDGNVVRYLDMELNWLVLSPEQEVVAGQILERLCEAQGVTAP